MRPEPNEGRRTKIVCTIGPSSDTPERIRRLLEGGMNVARLNFSHGSYDEHRRRCEAIRDAADGMGVTIGIMADLQGPKIRTGALQNHEPVYLLEDQPFCLTTRDVVGTHEIVSVDYEDLPRDVHPGDSIFLADGLLELQVKRIEDRDVHCEVVHGGQLGEHKGVNLPGVEISAPALGPKDMEDLAFALELDTDYIALSFVRKAEEVVDLKQRIANAGGVQRVVSKIERPEALKRFAEILEASDAIMLARGDLGVEVPLDEIPQIQKNLIGQCNDVGVPVITATQMLESMISHPRPTRAEVADVANAIYDGTDAVMLSGETASGDYPVQAVRVMAEVARKADESLARNPPHDRIVRMRESGIRTGRGSFGDAVCQSACRISHAIGARRIVCFTKTGATAALIARYRPEVPITALALDDAVRRRCAVIWGVDTACTIEPCTTDEMHERVDEVLLGNNLAEVGDVIVVAGGIPLAVRTRTNMLKIHRVGQAPGEDSDDWPSW